MNRPRNMNTKQHWVPRWYLRPWTNGKDKIQVLDKTKRSFFSTDLEGIGCQRGHFDFGGEDGRVDTADSDFSDIEKQVQPIITRIRESESITWMQRGQRRILAKFIITLIFSSINTKHMLREDFPRDIGTRKRDGVNDYGLEGTPEEAQAIFAISVREAPTTAVEHILAKRWGLRRSCEGRYVVGDNPAACHSETTNELGLVNVAIAAKYSQIFLPLSPCLLLHACCPHAVLQGQESGALPADPDALSEVILDLPAQTMCANEAQLRSAERHVYGLQEEDLFAVDALIDQRADLAMPHRPVESCDQLVDAVSSVAPAN